MERLISDRGVLDQALLYQAQMGWAVFPLHTIRDDRSCSCGKTACKDKGKHPVGQLAPNGFENASLDPSQVESWWETMPEANIGVRTGIESGIVVLDIDVDKDGYENLASLEDELGILPRTLTQTTGSGGRHLIFRHPGPDINCRNNIRPGIDFRGDGGYIVAPPSLHKCGKRYAWDSIPLDTSSIVELSDRWIEKIRRADTPDKIQPIDLSHIRFDSNAIPPPEKLKALLKSNPKARASWERDRHNIHPMKDESASGYDFSLWNFAMNYGWSYQEAFNLLIACRRKHGDDNDVEKLRRPDYLKRLIRKNPGSNGQDHEEGHMQEQNHNQAYNQTDAGNAELFADMNADRLRYDHRQKKWLIWRGHWWQEDVDGEVWRRSVEAARHRYRLAEKIEDTETRKKEAKWAISSESRNRRDAMIKDAQNLSPLADTGENWNKDQWLIGVQNGVVDLRTGQRRAGLRDDRIATHIDIEYDTTASCTKWLGFLQDIFEGDGDLIDFVQRSVGYSLTGNTNEQCLFICHGTGANGKSVFAKTIRYAFGPYAVNTPFSTFEQHARSQIPADVADLDGARFVTASETNEGTRLNEARVKALTGGDPITARPFYKDFFTFSPQCKIWFQVNHKPRVQDDSYGFWRRVHLIPFEALFTGDKADKHLDEKLKAEAPGILLWAVKGALIWQERGLDPPNKILSATNQYKEDSDPLREFIFTKCTEDPNREVQAQDLYKAYTKWAEDQGLSKKEILTNRIFGERMVAKYTRKPKKTGRVYQGIGLI